MYVVYSVRYCPFPSTLEIRVGKHMGAIVFRQKNTGCTTHAVVFFSTEVLGYDKKAKDCVASLTVRC